VSIWDWIKRFIDQFGLVLQRITGVSRGKTPPPPAAAFAVTVSPATVTISRTAPAGAPDRTHGTASVRATVTAGSSYHGTVNLAFEDATPGATGGANGVVFPWVGQDRESANGYPPEAIGGGPNGWQCDFFISGAPEGASLGVHNCRVKGWDESSGASTTAPVTVIVVDP